MVDEDESMAGMPAEVSSDLTRTRHQGHLEDSLLQPLLQCQQRLKNPSSTSLYFCRVLF